MALGDLGSWHQERGLGGWNLSLSLESLFDTRNYIIIIIIVIIIIIIIIIVMILGVRLMIGGFFPPDCCYRSFVLSLGVTMNTYCVVNYNTSYVY